MSDFRYRISWKGKGYPPVRQRGLREKSASLLFIYKGEESTQEIQPCKIVEFETPHDIVVELDAEIDSLFDKGTHQNFAGGVLAIPQKSMSIDFDRIERA